MDSVAVRFLRRRDLQELVDLGMIDPSGIPAKYGSFKVLNESSVYTNEPELQDSMAHNIKSLGDGTFNFSKLHDKWINELGRGKASFGEIVLSPSSGLNTVLVSSRCESLSKLDMYHDVKILFGNTFSWMIKDREKFKYKVRNKILWQGEVEFGTAEDQIDQFVEYVRGKTGVDMTKHFMDRTAPVSGGDARFLIQKPIVTADLKNIKIHCTCPFYRYYLAYANVFHRVDLVGKVPIVFNGKRVPSKQSYTRNKENRIGECKHIYYLIAKLSELGIVDEYEYGLDGSELRKLFEEFNLQRMVEYAKKQIPPEVTAQYVGDKELSPVSAQSVVRDESGFISVAADFKSADAVSAAKAIDKTGSGVTATKADSVSREVSAEETDEPVKLKKPPHKKKRGKNKVTVSAEGETGEQTVTADAVDELTDEVSIEDGGVEPKIPEVPTEEPKPKSKRKRKVKEEPSEEPEENKTDVSNVEVEKVSPEEDSEAGEFREDPKKIEYNLNLKSPPLEIDSRFGATGTLIVDGKPFVFPVLNRVIGSGSPLQYDKKSELEAFHRSIFNVLTRRNTKYMNANDINASVNFIKEYLSGEDVTPEQKRIASLSTPEMVIFVAMNLTKDKIDFLVKNTANHVEGEFADLANQVSDLLASGYVYRPVWDYKPVNVPVTGQRQTVQTPQQPTPQVPPQPKAVPQQPTTEQPQQEPQPVDNNEQEETEGLQESLLW